MRRRPRETTDEDRDLDLRICSIFFVVVAPAYWLIAGDWTGTTRAGDDLPADHADHLLPRLPRTADGAASGGPQGRRDRRGGRGARASSRRTAGGRCGARCAWPRWRSGVAVGWWLFIIGAALGAVRSVRADLRVLPRRARALSPQGGANGAFGFRIPVDSVNRATCVVRRVVAQSLLALGHLAFGEQRGPEITQHENDPVVEPPDVLPVPTYPPLPGRRRRWRSPLVISLLRPAPGDDSVPAGGSGLAGQQVVRGQDHQQHPAAAPGTSTSSASSSCGSRRAPSRRSR